MNEQEACGNYEVHKTERGRINLFYKFTKNDKITFPEITVDLLMRYCVYLKQIKKYRRDPNAPAEYLSERTVTNYFITIRTIYNPAITAKIASKDDYPFGADGKIGIKLTGSAKIGLDESEIKKLEGIDLTGHAPINNDAPNIWLIEFYFAGMRVSDCLTLQWKDFQNGRLYYQMSKNGGHGSVKDPAKELAIIDQNRLNRGDAVSNPHDLVFPFLRKLPSLEARYELRRTIAFVVKRLNKAMAKIMEMIDVTKNASQHKARHAFAQRAEEKKFTPSAAKNVPPRKHLDDNEISVKLFI